MNRISIQLKIAAAIGMIFAVSIALSVWTSVVNQRNALLESNRRSLFNNNGILNAVIQNLMLDGSAPLAVQTLADLKEIPGFSELEIYRANGDTAFSDYSTLQDVNEYQDFMTFSETERQPNEPVSQNNDAFWSAVNSNTPQIVEDLSDRRMEFYFPILNYAECRACHGTDHFVRGVAYYQISLEPVFDQIERGRNSLILFFLVTGAAIAAVLFATLKQVVINPVNSLGGVVTKVGTGNLDVRAQVKSRDEFGLLADKINSMISGLKEKQELEIQHSVVEARDQENQKYLDNIGQGLLLVGQDRRISPQYSRFLTELFGRTDVAGNTLSEFVYPDKDTDSPERKEIDEFIDLVFEKTATSMDMIMSVNPLKDKTLTVDSDQGPREIIVDTQFRRITGEDDQVETVMVIFTDKTGLVHMQQELERERERSESELNQIAAMLQHGPETFFSFVDEAYQTLVNIETTENQDEPWRRAMARELHSLKGTARYLEFRRVASLLNQLEDALEPGGETGLDQSRELMTSIRDELADISKINERFSAFATFSKEQASETGNLPPFVESLRSMTQELASELDKTAELTANLQVTTLPMLSDLRNAVIHLVRNAIDHGIEEPYARLAAGKSEAGAITISVSSDDRYYRIEVADDGAGIDYDGIRKRATDLGLIKETARPTHKELVQILFHPKFSTRTTATEISGRGVGLDAVIGDVKKLGGGLSVKSNVGRGTTVSLRVPVQGGEQ